MKLCDENHDEICFEGNNHTDCPLCKLIEEKEDEAAELQSEIDVLQQEVDRYENQEK